MTTSAERLPRLLAMVPWLLSHPGARVTEVAAEFGIPAKQVDADLRLLWMCGLPGHTPGDLIDVEWVGDRVYVSNAETIGRPLRLTRDEALALIVALRSFAELPGLMGGDAVERALAKIETAAGHAAEAVGHVEVTGDAEGAVVATVRESLERGRALHLRYYVPGRDETTERDVDPMRLVTSGGRPYLEAWCRRAEAVRLFRLDRVFDVRVLDQPAAVPQDARSRDVSGGLFQPSSDDTVVTLELEPPARWVGDYYPCETVEELPQGRLRVRLRTPDTRWVRRLVLGLGGGARMVDPAALADTVRADAAAALAAYGV